MNRVKTAQVPAAWGLSYDYDRYGNLLDKTVTQGGGPTELHVTVSNKNQINSGGFGYDAAGNLTSYDTQSYAYDGESRMTSTAGVSYSYDGDSLRVKKDQTSGSTYDTLYWQGIGLGLLFETDLTGTTEQGKSVLFNGQRLVRRADEKPYYYIDDHLGSRRLLLGPTGGNYHESDYYPFGGERVIVDTADAPHKFTGYERDAESGNDYAVFRYYNSNLGRFCSADPVGGDIANPQSLNRYTYVLNNPTNLIDPLGLESHDCTTTTLPGGATVVQCPLTPFPGDSGQSPPYTASLYGFGTYPTLTPGQGVFGDEATDRLPPEIPFTLGVPGLSTEGLLPPPPHCFGFVSPVNAPITSFFGDIDRIRGGDPHLGDDRSVPTGTPVRATTPGDVFIADPDFGRSHTMGGTVGIRNDLGITLLLHMSRIDVSVGQTVFPNTIVGLSGNTGRTTGPNAHLEQHDLSGPLFRPSDGILNPATARQPCR